MTLAERLAEKIAKQHGTNPWRVAERLGLIVSVDELPGQHREVYFETGDVAGVIVSCEANRADARALLAHGIAHHLLHVGDRITGKSKAIWSGRHEREAEDFAACLLIPAESVRRWEGAVDPLPLEELAEAYEVPVGLAERRARLSQLRQVA